MEFFLILVFGAIVVWLVSKSGADRQYRRQPYDLASRLEDSLFRLERAQELKAAPLHPEPQVQTQAQWTALVPRASHVPMIRDLASAPSISLYPPALAMARFLFEGDAFSSNPQMRANAMSIVRNEEQELNHDHNKFGALSRSHQEKMIKLHDRVPTLTGAPSKKDGRALPILASIVTIFPL